MFQILNMAREFTNLVRNIMDNFIPPVLRNNRVFMFPFFYVWYKGKNVTKYMNFKNSILNMSEDEYLSYYQNYDSAIKGKSDLSNKSINFITSNLGSDLEIKILDVGCGNGSILSELKKRGYKNITGMDINNEMIDKSIDFSLGNIEKMPFEANSFDIVICNQTIEHIINFSVAVKELKRVCKNKLILTTPKQQYYKYTFDLHLNFFPDKYHLVHLMEFEKYQCEDINGDWSFIGYKQ